MIKDYLRDDNGNRIDFNDISIESLCGHCLFGEIDIETSKEACTFILKANQIYKDRELTLFINTGGGDTNDGFALIDLMGMSRLPVKTVGMGMIASMGVLILSAGTKGKRIISRNTEVMAHQFSGGGDGKFHEVMAEAHANLYMRARFLEHFKRHSKMTEKQIETYLFGPTDKWLTPSECKKFGLVDGVVDQLPEFNLEIPSLQQRPARAARSKHQSPQ